MAQHPSYSAKAALDPPSGLRAASLFNQIQPPWWREVYVIGGGPSLQGFDFTRLFGRTVLAVNDACLYVPWAVCLFSLDHRWLQKRRKEIESFSGEVYCAVARAFPAHLGPSNAVYLRRLRDVRGLSTGPSHIHIGGGNSGYGAVNLAFLKKAKRIVLLGYDFDQPGKHWHKGYAWQGRPNPLMYARWAKALDSVAGQLRQAGVDVVNARPCLDEETKLQRYRRVLLDDLPL